MCSPGGGGQILFTLTNSGADEEGKKIAEKNFGMMVPALQKAGIVGAEVLPVEGGQGGSILLGQSIPDKSPPELPTHGEHSRHTGGEEKWQGGVEL